MIINCKKCKNPLIVKGKIGDFNPRVDTPREEEEKTKGYALTCTNTSCQNHNLDIYVDLNGKPISFP